MATTSSRAGKVTTACPLGAGDDAFIWFPSNGPNGDGSDVVDGGAGFDTLVFNGSTPNENFSISAKGEHVQLFRGVFRVGNSTMDLIGMERIDLTTRGGTDNVVVNDLTGTDVNRSTSTWASTSKASPITSRTR